MKDDLAASLDAIFAHGRNVVPEAVKSLLPCVGLALLVLAACQAKKPKAGDVCAIEDEGTYVCADPGTGLFCKASRRLAIPCRGPGGCAGPTAKASAAPVTCDTSLGREGDACVDDSETTCAEDKKAKLGCVDGKRVLDALCRGPKGCDPTRFLAQHDVCDRTIATAGDPCNVHNNGGEELGACSTDGQTALHCSDDYAKGTFVVVGVCHGPKGCTVGHLSGTDSALPVCDRSVAALGAECGSGDSNFLTCSTDGRSILRCSSSTKKYELESPCAAKTVCKHVMSGPLDDAVCVKSDP